MRFAIAVTMGLLGTAPELAQGQARRPMPSLPTSRAPGVVGTVRPPFAGAAPGNVAAAFNDAGAVMLSWQPAAGASGYQVARFGNLESDFRDLTPQALGSTVQSFTDNAPPVADGLAYMVWAVYPGGQRVESGLVRPSGGSAIAIRNYLDGLPRLSIQKTDRTSLPPQTIDLKGVAYGAQIEPVRAVTRTEEINLLDANDQVLWPGALIQGATLGEGSRMSGFIVDRAPGTIVITTDLATANPSAPRSRLIQNPTAETVNQARIELINALRPTGSAANFRFSRAMTRGAESGFTKVGIAFKAPYVEGDFKYSDAQNAEYSTLMVKATQVYYTITYQPNTTSAPFFGPNVTLADIQRYAGPTNPPVYVHKVNYGRVFVFTMRSSSNLSEFETTANLRISASGISGSASLNAAQKKMMQEASVNLLVRGGSPNGITEQVLKPSGGGDALDAILSYLNGQINWSGTPAPIGISTSYLGSVANQGANAVATVGLVSDYRDIVDLRPLQPSVCQNVSIADGSPSASPPGGALTLKGLPVAVGDHLTINWQGGEIWTGLKFFGKNGPEGFTTEPTPGEKFGKDAPNDYPIWDRKMYGLIARIGSGRNVGNSAASEKTAISDWFWVGQGYEGDADRAGSITLGFNDNNMDNGNPNDRMLVGVCVARRAYGGVGRT